MQNLKVSNTIRNVNMLGIVCNTLLINAKRHIQKSKWRTLKLVIDFARNNPRLWYQSNTFQPIFSNIFWSVAFNKPFVACVEPEKCAPRRQRWE
ncbi:hypothetical protein GDO78_008254 [Eleutherodactylus coqui]|uniref:Uncharacterized protein n=1 Tax=Eleutherodactylus coqui TaxID=57060 RepID=A0A8J6FBH7_ELECQ|nr:hypothetical protein GDO78_008254 [Eleutherodactylus coqui]